MSASTPRGGSILIGALHSPTQMAATNSESEAQPHLASSLKPQQQQQSHAGNGGPYAASSVQEQQQQQQRALGNQATPAVVAGGAQGTADQGVTPSGSRKPAVQQLPADMLPTLVVEVCLCFLSLLYCAGKGRKLVVLARAPDTGVQLTLAAKCMGVLSLSLKSGGAIAHLAALLMRPVMTLKHRDTWWFMHVGVLPVVYHLLQQQLLQEPTVQARRALLLCAAGMGMLNLSAPSFARW